jgi:hypothetical protein
MENGIYTNLTIEEYHGNTTHVSATQIKLAKRSLKEFEWSRRGLMTKQKKMHLDFGNAFELALMDRELFSQKVLLYDETNRPEPEKAMNSKLNSQWKKDLFDTAAYVINNSGDESIEAIEHMVESCYQDAVIKKLITNIDYQVSLFWTDEESGINLKTRPDICKTKKNVVVNIKTTLDGSPKAFSRDLANYEYPLQACIEVSGCLNTGLMPAVDKYFWLVVEKVPPYNATLYEFEEGEIQASRDELQYLLNKLASARKQNLYPGYSDRADNPYGILKAEIPMYYRIMS